MFKDVLRYLNIYKLIFIQKAWFRFRKLTSFEMAYN